MLVQDFLDRFNVRLDYFLDLMQNTWGFRPGLTVSHQWVVRIDVTYPKGYARWHDTRKFFIKQSASGKTRNPNRIAAYVAIPDYQHHQGKKYPKCDPFATAQEWVDAFQTDLQTALKSVEHKEKKKIKVEVDTGIAIKVDFNLQGFAHKSQTVYCTNKTMAKHRKPELVARMFAVELTGHRNSCKQCGIGIPSIYARAKGYNWGGGNPNVPPDAVEEILHPQLSRALTSRLETIQGSGAYTVKAVPVKRNPKKIGASVTKGV
jgi:hypothetical protein